MELLQSSALPLGYPAIRPPSLTTPTPAASASCLRISPIRQPLEDRCPPTHCHPRVHGTGIQPLDPPGTAPSAPAGHRVHLEGLRPKGAWGLPTASGTSLGAIPELGRPHKPERSGPGRGFCGLGRPAVHRLGNTPRNCPRGDAMPNEIRRYGRVQLCATRTRPRCGLGHRRDRFHPLIPRQPESPRRGSPVMTFMQGRRVRDRVLGAASKGLAA